MSRYPGYPVSIMALHHGSAESYFDWENPPKNQMVAYVRECFREIAAKNNDILEKYSIKDTFYDLSDLIGPVLMSNHLNNMQETRFFEKKLIRVRVSGAEDFPNFALDFKRFQELSNHFKKNLNYYVLLIRAYFTNYFIRSLKPK